MSEAISNEHQRGSTTSGNITSINGVGTLIYGEGTGVSSYEVTRLIPEPGQTDYSGTVKIQLRTGWYSLDRLLSKLSWALSIECLRY